MGLIKRQARTAAGRQWPMGAGPRLASTQSARGCLVPPVCKCKGSSAARVQMVLCMPCANDQRVRDCCCHRLAPAHLLIYYYIHCPSPGPARRHRHRIAPPPPPPPPLASHLPAAASLAGPWRHSFVRASRPVCAWLGHSTTSVDYYPTLNTPPTVATL